jgi:peptidoglycan/xylan/chitin deacetylase (PgdA/CDA1 family)
LIPYRAGFKWFSPAGAGARLTVLIFHRVLVAKDPIFPNEVYAHRFDEICSWLKAWFNVLPLDQAVVQLKTGALPARAACITFDDGYADNLGIAVPILKAHGLTATFFIATGFLNGGRMWNDTIIEAVRGSSGPSLDLSSIGLGCHPIASPDAKRAAIEAIISQIKYLPMAERIRMTEKLAQVSGVTVPINLMMTSQGVKAMRAAGMQIGAHTMSHPILATLSAQQARDEICGSQEFLEQLLGERIGLFAYPNGKPGEDYSPQTVDVVRKLGFDAAVSTAWGASRTGDDLLQIKRFTPWDRSKLRFGARLLSNLRSA